MNGIPLSTKLFLAQAIKDGHPAEVLDRIVTAFPGQGKDLIFTFKALEFEPGEYDALDDAYTDHEVLSIVGEEVGLGGPKVKEFFDSAKMQGFDVVLLSKVGLVGQPLVEFHIPMLDGGCAASADIFSELQDFDVLKKLGLDFDDFRFYDSGRSFHGYGTKLMTPPEFLKYLGALLLLNIPGYSPVVDARWVGHALVKGCAGLRWTANNTRYLKVPEGIDCPF